jgi:methanogenic corrinoid protein MtbC1
VTDLGIDVPPAYFVEEARHLRPDVVGLSGLLTLSYDSMQNTVQLLRKAEDTGLARIPVIVGGGLLNPQVCAYVGADYWAIDAMVGVNQCKQIVARDRSA